jgi:hypothetical protein
MIAKLTAMLDPPMDGYCRPPRSKLVFPEGVAVRRVKPPAKKRLPPRGVEVINRRTAQVVPADFIAAWML